MATTSGDSLFYPTGGDQVAPLNTVMATMQSSNQTAFNRRANYSYRWVNAAALNAQTGMRVGDKGFRVDTAAYYTYDGAAWQADNGAWVGIDLRTGYTAGSPTPAYKVVNGTVFLRGNVNRSGGASMAVLPAGVAPSNSSAFLCVGADNTVTRRITVGTDGALGVTEGGTFSSLSLSSISYPLG